MEIILFIFILIFLIVIFNNQNSKFNTLEKNLSDLNKRFEILRKQGLIIEKAKEDLPPVKEEKPYFTPVPDSQMPAEEKKPEPKIIPKEENPKVEKAAFSENIPAEKPKLQQVSETRETPRPAVPRQEAPRVILPPQKSWWKRFKENNPDLEKFIGENLINKIGILILALGISYLVKLGIDQNVITEPMRVGIGILAGSIVMLFAHKLRINYKAFSSVLVAGAISIFYFTIAIAFHDYHLIGQTVAFIIMVVITLFSAFISISYDRMELAAISLIGAFAVPFMVSTGQGNYVVLLTYILIIDIGILLIAYFKKWNFLNIQAYVFTMLLYCGWLSTIIGEAKAPYLGALIFGFLFYFTFILMNIINNIKNKGEFSNLQLAILSSNTLIFYGSGMLIFNSYHPEFKGLFTTILALFNLIYAWYLYKRFGVEKRVIYVLIGMTLTFATLAIPIQFEGNYITLFWAAEAVVLIWLSQKSEIKTFKFASAIVHFLMLLSLIMDWSKLYNSETILALIINPAFLTGLFAIASYIAVSYLLRKETEQSIFLGINFHPQNYSTYAKIIAVILAYFAGFIELSYQANLYLESSDGASYLKAIYHFIFSAVFIAVAFKNNRIWFKNLASILASLNILLFIFLTSHFAFSDLDSYMARITSFPLAYLLHFVALLLTAYFVFILYKTRAENFVFKQFSTKTMLVIGSLLLVYLASSELMLHTVAISGNQITPAETLEALKNYPGLDKLGATYYYVGSKIDDIENQVIKTGYPILWGALAFLFLIVGIKRNVKNLRIIALILLGITILKLFVYDIRNASETGKIIAFILLGVLILIISFVYQKLKVLVLSNPTEEKPTDENR